MIKKMLGRAILDKQQPFENVILGLLLVAKNDVIDSWGLYPINMQERRKYFSEKGWA